MNDQMDFSLTETVKARRSLRRVLGLGAESFAKKAFMDMLKDEIAQLQTSGRTNDEIANIISASVGRHIYPDDVVVASH